MSAGTFVAGETGFFSAGAGFGCVPAWLLVIRTLGRRNWDGCYCGASCGLRFPVQWPLSPARMRGLAPGEQWRRLAGW